jgi:hypothetical protein
MAEENTNMDARLVNLNPYIRCSVALQRFISICTYSPLLASMAAAITFYMACFPYCSHHLSHFLRSVLCAQEAVLK